MSSRFDIIRKVCVGERPDLEDISMSSWTENDTDNSNTNATTNVNASANANANAKDCSQDEERRVRTLIGYCWAHDPSLRPRARPIATVLEAIATATSADADADADADANANANRNANAKLSARRVDKMLSKMGNRKVKGSASQSSIHSLAGAGTGRPVTTLDSWE